MDMNTQAPRPEQTDGTPRGEVLRALQEMERDLIRLKTDILHLKYDHNLRGMSRIIC